MTGFPGFDTAFYPGDAVMAWLKANTNFVWCGFYLGSAPSHPHTDWMDKRARLVAQGWGLAPVYVGQQVTGPGSLHPSAAQGTTDGADAAALMRAAGFPKDSYVYLDIENGPPLQPTQIAYLASWTAGVTGGGYKAGVYCSWHLAAQVAGLHPNARVWPFHVQNIAPHAVAGQKFPDLAPSGSGHPAAFIWQHDDQCAITVPAAHGGKLTVDLDTALTADPSC